MLQGVKIYDLTVWCRVSEPISWERIEFEKILNEEGNEILPHLQDHEKEAIIQELENGREKSGQLSTRSQNVKRAS